MYMKSLRWALAVMAVLLAVSTVAIVALASRTGMVPPPSYTLTGNRGQPLPGGLWAPHKLYSLLRSLPTCLPLSQGSGQVLIFLRSMHSAH